MAHTEHRIRKARRESGLSQEALAERIGVTPADVHRYEEGAEVSARHLQLIAVATGKSVSFFLGDGGPAAQNGRRIGGRLRGALAWLSQPAHADTEADALLAEIAARERALAERERRLAERERRLVEATEQPAAAPVARFKLSALEHALQERAGEFPEREEEWRAYMVFLREFVQPDGDLPPTFNALVREVFRELL